MSESSTIEYTISNLERARQGARDGNSDGNSGLGERGGCSTAGSREGRMHSGWGAEGGPPESFACTGFTSQWQQPRLAGAAAAAWGGAFSPGVAHGGDAAAIGVLQHRPASLTPWALKTACTRTGQRHTRPGGITLSLRCRWGGGAQRCAPRLAPRTSGACPAACLAKFFQNQRLPKGGGG